MEKVLSITFIISAFNEETTIENSIKSILGAVNLFNNLDYEILIINDASFDNTRSICERLLSKYDKVKLFNHEKNLGLGLVFKTGVKLASKKFILLYAGDDEAGTEGILPLLYSLNEADILIPYPINNNIRGYFRSIISKLFVTLIRLISGINLNYYNGSVVHKKEIIEKYNLDTSGFGYQARLTIELIYDGYSFIQIPIKLNNNNDSQKKSYAFKLKNILSISKTIYYLLYLRIKCILKIQNTK